MEHLLLSRLCYVMVSLLILRYGITLVAYIKASLETRAGQNCYTVIICQDYEANKLHRMLIHMFHVALRKAMPIFYL